MVRLLQIFQTALPLVGLCEARVTTNLQTLNSKDVGLTPAKRVDSDLTGYLGAFFLGDEPDVYFYLSQNDSAISFSALNGGKPILVPTVGTGGVRDPAIVSGGGSEAGQKWYIVGTDLDISKVRRCDKQCPRNTFKLLTVTGCLDDMGRV